MWALVGQVVLQGALTAVLAWWASGWHPQFAFSRTSFRRFFGFGSRVTCSSLINGVYANLHTLVIGRCFGAADVGHFNRADGFAGIPAFSFADVILKVCYPALAQIQDDERKLREAYRRLLCRSFFWLVPILLGMASYLALAGLFRLFWYNKA